MKAYPIELRERIVAEVDRNQRTIAEIAELFQISERTVYNLLALRSATGSVTPRPHGGGAVAKIDASIREDLRTLIKENPDATLEELQQMVRKRHKLSVGLTAIWKAVRRIRMSVKKKTRRAQEADPKAREEFKRKQPKLPTSRIFFIDEFGIHLNMTRRYARAPIGERAVITEAFGTGTNISVISALTLDGVSCPMMIEGAIDTQVLRAYVEHIVVPELTEGDIVIWDNLAIHKDAEVRRMIEEAGARIEPLPSYSPDLNPKEECISKIKTYLRKVKADTVLKLTKALKCAIDLVTGDDARGWIAHAGYSL